MKYGESFFDILYLVFAIVTGFRILKASKPDSAGRLMGIATLILGFGDAFHLVPRVLNYFVDADFTAALGVGKLVTSITMTVFYVIMLLIYKKLFGGGNLRTMYILAAIRVILCLLPQNQWITNEGSVTMGIIRNIPFVIIGLMIVILYYIKRTEIRELRNVWILVALSFIFYIPVAVGASVVPMLGMLMLPKTVCYMILIYCFYRFVKRRDA